MNPCILKNMDISTCHITERDSQLLGLVEQENPLVEKILLHKGEAQAGGEAIPPSIKKGNIPADGSTGI